MWRSQARSRGVSSLLRPCGLWALTSGGQALQRALLATEPSPQSLLCVCVDEVASDRGALGGADAVAAAGCPWPGHCTPKMRKTGSAAMGTGM